MALYYKGDFDQLKLAIEQRGIRGSWESNDQKHVFRKDGALLTWWIKKGTVLIQGPELARKRMEDTITDILKLIAEGSLPCQSQPKIFVVHGHDREAREQLELALHKLGLSPFVLLNSSGGGKTIIEALEGCIGKEFSTHFGIVLMTPDDMGYSIQDGQDNVKPRPRQNVILETGMLLSSLTRERMAILIKGNLEIPSDLSGIIHFSFTNHVRETIPKLCTRLKEVGFQIELEHLAEAAQ